MSLIETIPRNQKDNILVSERSCTKASKTRAKKKERKNSYRARANLAWQLPWKLVTSGGIQCLRYFSRLCLILYFDNIKRSWYRQYAAAGLTRRFTIALISILSRKNFFHFEDVEKSNVLEWSIGRNRESKLSPVSRLQARNTETSKLKNKAVLWKEILIKTKIKKRIFIPSIRYGRL